MRKHIWGPIPANETIRLSKILQTHLRTANIKLTAQARLDFVKALLIKQNSTCILDNGHGCCWNHPKDSALEYLKLEWGHKMPQSLGITKSIDGFYLMCARCNNHLQSSRTLPEIKYEFMEKIKQIDLILES